jgi:phytoene synthase
MVAEVFSSLSGEVRKTDYDRYLSALFARAEARPHLFALYAFNHEIAKTAETVSQPVLGLVRLNWWRETVQEIYTGRVREHDVAQALAKTVEARALPRALIDAMIDARESDLEETPFADLAQMKAYADATSGNLMRLAARSLGAGDALDKAAYEAGVAYALTGLLRALPFRAARRNLVLPLEPLRAAGLSAEDVFAGKAGPQLSSVIGEVGGHAMAHLRAAREMQIPRRFLAAFLTAALVPVHLRAMMRPGFDPFHDAAEIAIHGTQFAMLRAMLAGRV